MFIGLIIIAIVVGYYAHWIFLLAVCAYIVVSFFEGLNMILKLHEKDVEIKKISEEIADSRMMLTIMSRDRD